MNWGKNLTMIGAIRIDGWLTLSTMWQATTKHTFVEWVRLRLAPKLRPGDIVVMDNLPAHKDSRVEELIRDRGATLKFLPPYSPDLNPIEPAWAVVKQRLKYYAARCPRALRRAAHRARRAIKPRQCASWYAHAGYSAQHN